MKLNLKVVVALAFSSSILTLAAPMPQGGDWAIVKGLKSAKKLLRGQSSSGRARYAAEQAHAEDLTASHHASSPGRAGGPEYDRQMVLYQGATEHERSYRPSPEHYGSSNQHHESSPARSSVHSEDEWTPLSPPRRQQSVPGGAMVPYVEQPREQPQPFYGMQYVSTSPRATQLPVATEPLSTCTRIIITMATSTSELNTLLLPTDPTLRPLGAIMVGTNQDKPGVDTTSKVDTGAAVSIERRPLL